MAFFKPRDIWTFIGIVLFLIALYLVLTHASGFDGIIAAISGASLAGVGVLQGRQTVSAPGGSTSGVTL